MVGSKIYDIMSVSSAAKSIISRNVALQKANCYYNISSQRTLLSLISPFTQKIGINLLNCIPSSKKSTYNDSYFLNGELLSSRQFTAGTSPTNPLGFDRRPHTSTNSEIQQIENVLKREYSTKGPDPEKKTGKAIGCAPEKDVSR